VTSAAVFKASLLVLTIHGDYISEITSKLNVQLYTRALRSSPVDLPVNDSDINRFLQGQSARHAACIQGKRVSMITFCHVSTGKQKGFVHSHRSEGKGSTKEVLSHHHVGAEVFSDGVICTK
jgi:hypothetical protein